MRLSYLLAVFIVTVLCGLIYVSVQQSYRSGANDPQLQLARDIREKLKNGQTADRLWAQDTVNLETSLAVFTALYDNNGEPIRSNGLLNGQLPRLPKGVFEYARKKEEHMLTWQPRHGVRMAMVIESVQVGNTGFVAAGRSLREVEKRVSNLVTMLLIGWLFCMAAIILYAIIISFKKNNK